MMSNTNYVLPVGETVTSVTSMPVTLRPLTREEAKDAVTEGVIAWPNLEGMGALRDLLPMSVAGLLSHPAIQAITSEHVRPTLDKFLAIAERYKSKMRLWSEESNPDIGIHTWISRRCSLSIIKLIQSEEDWKNDMSCLKENLPDDRLRVYAHSTNIKSVMEELIRMRQVDPLIVVSANTIDTIYYGEDSPEYRPIPEGMPKSHRYVDFDAANLIDLKGKRCVTAFRMHEDQAVLMMFFGRA